MLFVTAILLLSNSTVYPNQANTETELATNNPSIYLTEKEFALFQSLAHRLPDKGYDHLAQCCTRVIKGYKTVDMQTYEAYPNELAQFIDENPENLDEHIILNATRVLQDLAQLQSHREQEGKPPVHFQKDVLIEGGLFVDAICSKDCIIPVRICAINSDGPICTPELITDKISAKTGSAICFNGELLVDVIKAKNTGEVCMASPLALTTIKGKNGSDICVKNRLKVDTIKADEAAHVTIESKLRVDQIGGSSTPNPKTTFCDDVCIAQDKTLQVNKIQAKTGTEVCIDPMHKLAVNTIKGKDGEVCVEGILRVAQIGAKSNDGVIKFNNKILVDKIGGNSGAIPKTTFCDDVCIIPEKKLKVSTIKGNGMDVCVDSILRVAKISAKPQEDTVQICNKLLVDEIGGKTSPNTKLTLSDDVCIAPNKTLSVDKLACKSGDTLEISPGCKLVVNSIGGHPGGNGTLTVCNGLQVNGAISASSISSSGNISADGLLSASSISSSGNISATGNLSVCGDITAKGTIFGTINAAQITTQQISTGSAIVEGVVEAGEAIVEGVVSAGNAIVNWFQSWSDERIKPVNTRSAIDPDESLTAVLGLAPQRFTITYTDKDNNLVELPGFGLIAQEAINEFPEAVDVLPQFTLGNTTFNNFHVINLGNLSTGLIGAIKALQNQIDDIKQDIEDLQNT